MLISWAVIVEEAMTVEWAHAVDQEEAVVALDAPEQQGCTLW